MRKNDRSAAVRFELKGALFTDVEAWRARQARIPPRATAIRRLVEMGIDSEGELNAKVENEELS